MGETSRTIKTTEIELPAPNGVRIEQTSTRGDGSVEQVEPFAKDIIDFSGALDHIGIHTEGAVAGSQFNGELFDSPSGVADMVTDALPETLHYDQHGRVELTLTIEDKDKVVGYSGVQSLDKLEGAEGVRIERAMRMPGGESAEVDGIKGAWYPEMTRNPNTGKFEIALNPDGSVKNSQGKFEPEALIATVEQQEATEALATDQLTVIVQRNPENDLPTVLTIFPGENAPAYPTKIQSEAFQVDTLKDGPEAAYWADHTFVKAV